MKDNKQVYGGQAVVEGVMFGGKHNFVTAIRRKDKSIEFLRLPREKKPSLEKLKRIPFLRGIIALFEASINGTKHLNFSTDRYDVHPDDDHLIEEEEVSKITLILGVAVISVLTFLFSKFIFTLVPVFLAELTKPIFPGKMAQIFVETTFKLILLLSYIYVVSLTPLIKDVFKYHGAEHKVINAYENDLQLTVENVKSQSRLHYRCGSSFILFTVIVGMFVYMLVPTEPLIVRVLNRLALIPVVLGISFEVLQLTNKMRNIPILKYLGLPGLWLQLLTTKEPEDDQIEVAIISFNELLNLEKESEERLKKAEIVNSN